MLSKNPTEAEKATYQTWLSEAEAAYQRLMIGAAEVSVSYNGEQTTFQAVSRPQLLAWINDLRRALGKGTSANPGFAIKPVVFGGRKSGGSGLF